MKNTPTIENINWNEMYLYKNENKSFQGLFNAINMHS